MLQFIPRPSLDEAQQLYTLQRAAYQVESDLLQYPHLPPLQESFTQFYQAAEQWLVWREDSTPVGALAFVPQGHELEICRLVVAPTHFRRGLARHLLQGLETTAPHALKISVATAARNLPAVQLYQRHGYTVTRQTILPDGLILVHLEKDLAYAHR